MTASRCWRLGELRVLWRRQAKRALSRSFSRCSSSRRGPVPEVPEGPVIRRVGEGGVAVRRTIGAFRRPIPAASSLAQSGGAGIGTGRKRSGGSPPPGLTLRGAARRQAKELRSWQPDGSRPRRSSAGRMRLSGLCLERPAVEASNLYPSAREGYRSFIVERMWSNCGPCGIGTAGAINSTIAILRVTIRRRRINWNGWSSPPSPSSDLHRCGRYIRGAESLLVSSATGGALRRQVMARGDVRPAKVTAG